MSFNVRLTIVAITLALVIFIGFAVSVPRAREVRETELAQESRTVPAVTLEDTYKKGTHTLSGTVTAPDACTTASASATFTSTTDAVILLDISMPPTTGICLTVPTGAEFETTIDAPAETQIRVLVNGAAASTTVL